MNKNVIRTPKNSEGFAVDLNELKPQMQPYERYPNGFTIYLPIFGEIGYDLNAYKELLTTIRTATPYDTLRLQIDSPGGSLTTTVALLNALRQTPASVECEILCQCASAATLLFLVGDKFIINQNIEFMIHNYSSGAFGKGGEMVSKVGFEEDWASKLLASSYKDFLSEQEIEDMKKGVDFYFDDEETELRISEMCKKREIEAEESKVVHYKFTKDSLIELIDNSESREDLLNTLNELEKEQLNNSNQ